MFQKIKENLIDLFFPAHCVSCNALGSLLCDSCTREISLFKRKENIYSPLDSSLTCILAVGHFKDTVLKEAIHKYKYEGISALALTFAGMMARRVEDERIDFDCLAYVPITKRRERWRGYNQSELLVEELGGHFNKPVLSGLCKVKETKTQVGLPKKEREKNLKSAFRYRGPKITGKKILLVDDVTTTGTTLNECAKILRKKGAREVIGVIIAKE